MRSVSVFVNDNAEDASDHVDRMRKQTTRNAVETLKQQRVTPVLHQTSSRNRARAITLKILFVSGRTRMLEARNIPVFVLFRQRLSVLFGERGLILS